MSGNCELCKERIEKTAKSLKGVATAIWDIQTKKIKVDYNNNLTTPDEIQKAISLAGHDTEKFKAPDNVYNQLPECCLNRK